MVGHGGVGMAAEAGDSRSGSILSQETERWMLMLSSFSPSHSVQGPGPGDGAAHVQEGCSLLS